MSNDHVAEPFRSTLAAFSDPMVDALVHSQKIAQQIGAANMAVNVYGWAIRHAMIIPQPAFKELLDIVGREP